MPPKNTSKKQPVGTIKEVSFSNELGERYLAYALSTITSRSLPDVRDGLKPVHRRLLYAMMQLRLDPEAGFKKCARVVGDVIGKYHPHGDTAVYDTMVRLAQSFSVRYTLVEGQGNFGSIDGDNAAAMRYTEARLTEVAMALLQDIDQDTVDFRDTYDNQDKEPIVLPANFPNLLANGSEGIAVGMATSIPPHNAREICDALLYLIKQPNARAETLVQYVHGPDFPTGGVLVESQENIINAYKTGRGAFRVRAKWEKEELSHGMYQIIVTEIPYQVQKSRLIEKIAELFKEKKLALLGNIRDESTENIRIVLEPKSRSVDPEMLMESLFKITDLETRFNMNMNVLNADGIPQVMNLAEVLKSFLGHRHEVLIRKSRYRLGKIDLRLEILDGLLIAYLNIDEVIRIIRQEDDPKAKMIKKWKLTDNQAEAILNMKLRNLRKLEEIEIKREHNELMAEKKNLQKLLKNEDMRWEMIADQVREIKKKFGQKTEIGTRRTEIAEPPIAKVISIEAFVEKEPITIICSELGWIRAIKGHEIDIKELKYKEGDKERFILKAQTTDKLVIFGTNGRSYTIGCDKLPRGKGHGEPVRLMIDIEQEHDICHMFAYQGERKFLLAVDMGKGFILPEEEMIAQKKAGKQIVNLPEGHRVTACMVVEGDYVAILGENRKLLIFPIAEVPEMKRGQGVQLQKYKDGGMADIKIFKKLEGLTWAVGDKTRTETNITEWVAKRGHAGRLPPSGFPRKNKFS